MPNTSPKNLQEIKPGIFPSARFGRVPTLSAPTHESGTILATGDAAASPAPADLTGPGGTISGVDDRTRQRRERFKTESAVTPCEST